MHEDGIMSSAYVRLIPRSAVDIRFFFQQYFDLYHRGIYNQLGAGVRSTLGPSDLLDLSVVLPPLPEQAAIIRFIDHVDRRIRRYIRAKQKLIKLLEEQKQAIIHRAVTRGLDPHGRLKPSGVGWLGDVPEHWEVRRLKALVTESVAGPYGSSLTKSMYTSAGYRVYGQQQVIPNDFSTGDYYISAEKYEEMKRYRVFPGDVLVSVMGTVGRVAVVPELVEPGIINPRLVRHRPNFKMVRPQYLQLAMQSPPARAQMNEAAKGTTMDGLNRQILGGVLLGTPPLIEQDAILSSVNSDTEQLKKATNAASWNVTLLREYRTRLTADVVTGKLDVREAAARLPDEVEEAESVDEADGLSDEEGRRGGVRLDHRRHRPEDPRPADQGHHQAVRAGGRYGGARRALG